MLIRVLLLVALLTVATPVAAASVSIVIDISDQHMQVSVGGAPKYSFDVSTGRKGYATPKGSYGVQRMYKEYYSKKYDLAPMPYSIFFRGGYAIHGTYDTKRLGRVASHGCVRLAPENARRLYNLVLKHGSGNVSIRVKG
ncbi:MAG TPA: L,D-transpeptidase [Devosia sp.]|jgi:lipoprotein-anchoring transpeptidase ErfK/SrfK|uniref:L,D-transpeptidase n=1 Tax=Devosia sp. TaxID=1871048 RepID=UPI002DDD00FE|nr:L,D-transpeptidase [Devosia sp.]HEV2517559.1 L,D-transpeptidase [Devosia sp.]